MSESNINDLPSEILIKVFRYLNEVEWKSATLTCKLWNDLIESSCRWVLRLRHDVPPNQQRINFILTTTRKFHTIELYGSQFRIDNEILKILQRHGINIVNLRMEGVQSNPNLFAEHLNLMPNLKEAYVSRTFFYYAYEESPIQVLPELKKLKNLVLFYSDHRIIECFENAKLKKLKVATDVHFRDCEPLVNFLKFQESLTSLCVHALFDSLSILGELGKLTEPIRFKLTELSIMETALTRNRIEYDRILKFLNSQATNVKQLVIKNGIPSFIYDFVFAKMTNLTTLSMYVGHIPRERQLYNRLKVNGSVRTLILSGWVDTSQNYESFQDYCIIPHFLKIFPNIHSLVLPDGCGNNLLLVQSLSQLESISVGYINETTFLNATFPKLKTLKITYLPDKVNWNDFAMAHTQLTELTIVSIRNESILTSDDIDQIMANAVNLHTLKLGKGFVADETFFEVIRIRCRKLKVFELHKSCIPCELKCNTNGLLRLCDYIQYPEYFSL